MIKGECCLNYNKSDGACYSRKCKTMSDTTNCSSCFDGYYLSGTAAAKFGCCVEGYYFHATTLVCTVIAAARINIGKIEWKNSAAVASCKSGYY